MSKNLTSEKIKERIIENLQRSGARQETSAIPVGLQTAESNTKGNALGSLESIVWKMGIRSAGLIKKIPVLNYISGKVYQRLVMKQTSAPAGSIVNRSDNTGSMNIDAMWNYDVFLKMIEKEGLKGKVKRSVFSLIGFYAWWQSQVNRELLNMIEEHKKLINTLFHNDDSIRGIAHLSLEKIERFQDSLNAETDRIFETINELRNNVRHLHHADMEAIGKLRETLNSAISELTTKLTELTERMDMYKMESSYLDRKLGIINHELKKHGSLKNGDLIKDLPKISLDEIRYLFFENKYRGSREDIKERQKQYLGFVLKARDNANGDFVLDIGCGRGEFLELLDENSIPARGIDTNEGMVEVCRNRSLDVDKSDALEFLNALPDNSLIGLTAFQVVEHLPVEYLVEFIKTSFQKIHDGGVIILETINPYSVLAMKYFWMDPTHVKPIPPDTLKFLMDIAGFRNIEVKFLSPVSDELRLTGGDRNTKLLNDLLFGHQDYAVIGWK